MHSLITPDNRTTSHIVAERFNKRHEDVLRSVRKLKERPDFFSRNFAFNSTKTGGPGRPTTTYTMTRDGFSLLVMGFAGQDALAWKIKFLDAFNEMERRLSDDEPPALPTTQRDDHLPAACHGQLAVEATLGHNEHTAAIRSALLARLAASELPAHIRLKAVHSMVDMPLCEGILAHRLLCEISSSFSVN